MKTFLQPNPPRALLFDIDNTLYRNDEYVDAQITGQIERFAEERNISPSEARSVVEHAKDELERSEGSRPSLANTLVALGVPISVSVAWRLERIVPESYLVQDEEIGSALSALKEVFPLAALTNNPQEIGIRSLQAIGIAHHFESVTGLDSSGESKPSWGPFAHALAALRVEASEVVMVGDRYAVDLEPIVCRGGGAVLIESREDVLSLPSLFRDHYGLSIRP